MSECAGFEVHFQHLGSSADEPAAANGAGTERQRSTGWLPRDRSRRASQREMSPTKHPSACRCCSPHACLQTHSACIVRTSLLSYAPGDACFHKLPLATTGLRTGMYRSWDEKQRERIRLAKLAMLERDNHHTDNTHMMKVQNLADDEIVGGGKQIAHSERSVDAHQFTPAAIEEYAACRHL